MRGEQADLDDLYGGQLSGQASKYAVLYTTPLIEDGGGGGVNGFTVLVLLVLVTIVMIGITQLLYTMFLIGFQNHMQLLC